ncbi:MAG: 2-C-methyl-D-erythritol 4-phosphate cytidylyltransferase [Lachnospiraceae bacterium]|nr:2-C-methyl-D-erythritol 4-phosphate cytidylyltransferase [Lachnospiraceae bacterium]
MKRKKNALVLLAGGRGSRMHSDVPKQFMMLGDKPLIWHALNTVQRSELIDEVVLVSSSDDIPVIRDIVDRNGFDKVSHITSGGKERFLSVVNGVLALSEKNGSCEAFDGGPEVILIHDGARPFLDDGIIERCLEGVTETGGCVAAVPSKDTVKLAGEDGIVTSEPPRSKVWCMQTPQVFDSRILFDVCRRVKEEMSSDDPKVKERLSGITDDARMVSLFTDTRIKLVMGSYENLKVTTPEDIIIAERILEERSGHIS